MIYITISNFADRILSFAIGVVLIYFSYIMLREILKKKKKRDEKK